MKNHVLRYPEFEQIPGDFWKRIAPFLIISCALHLVLAVSIFSLPSPEYLEIENPRKPILVDFMEHKEGSSPEPASLSPIPLAPKMPAQESRPKTPPPSPPQQPPAKMERGKSAKIGQRKAEREGVSRSQPETPVRAPAEVEKLVEASPRTLPSAKDLIPSLRDLMSWQIPDGKFHQAHFEQDGVGDDPARVQYDAYLSILKQRVKERWNVSALTDVREATTVVWFVVGSDGSLQSLELARSSGRVLLDHKAMAAIRGSFPLQAPPKTLLDENGVLNIQFTFRYMVYAPYSKNPRKGRNRWVVD
jgi:TonB family protein